MTPPDNAPVDDLSGLSSACRGVLRSRGIKTAGQARAALATGRPIAGVGPTFRAQLTAALEGRPMHTTKPGPDSLLSTAADLRMRAGEAFADGRDDDAAKLRTMAEEVGALAERLRSFYPTPSGPTPRGA